MSVKRLWNLSGASLRRSSVFVEKNGCQNLAAVATSAPKILADAAARLCCSPATRPQPTRRAHWRRRTTLSKRRCLKPIAARPFRTRFPPRHSSSCSEPKVFGVTETIRNSEPGITDPSRRSVLPTQSDRDGTHVGGDAVVRSMQEPVFPVDFDATRHLARHAAPEVVTEFVQAGTDKAAAERNEGIRILASTPPHPERTAPRTRNRSV